MARVRIEDALQLASDHRRAGRVKEAEAIYRQILQAAPQHPGALNGLAILMAQAGRFDAATDYFAKAAALMPNNAEVLGNLAHCYLRWGKIDQAIQPLRELARLPGASAVAHFQLAAALAQTGKLDEAAKFYQQAIALEPHHAEWHVNLGAILEATGHLPQAKTAYERALATSPNLVGAHNNLGNLLAKMGDAPAAINHLQRALQLDPQCAEAHNNLGNVLIQQSRFAEAEQSLRKALDLLPNDAEMHNNLGNALKEQNRFDEAAHHFRRATELAPTLAGPPNNLGNTLRELGQLDEAIACYQRAIALAPDDPIFASNRLCALQYLDTDPAAILSESRQWNDRFARPATRTYTNDRSPNRRLKIGYVSADLRMHSVAFFLLPLLEAHNHDHVHITCYPTSAKRDAMTQRMQSHADAWQNLAGLSDTAAADLIARDRIDILVDLTGHTAGGRLRLFTLKPAPLQLTYLGYPGTTGLSAVDYRLSDPWADPEPAADATSSEKILRLPGGAWCFAPIAGSPAVPDLPASSARTGPITFGTFNSFSKVTPRMLALWADILNRVTNSRLIVKNTAMASPAAAARLRQFFSHRGIAPDRIDLLPPHPGIHEHLQTYRRLDIALDTFPYHGTTTTCEALYMGVPVITLAGNRHASRVGVSLLTSVGLPQFIANTDQDYVNIAANLAADQQQLANLRHNLRDRMTNSPLMNAHRLAQEIEQAYRTIWQTWLSR